MYLGYFDYNKIMKPIRYYTALYGAKLAVFTLKKLGIECIYVDNDASDEEIKAAFEQAKANTKGPTVIEFYIDPTANVFPMVPGGKSLNDMIMDC